MSGYLLIDYETENIVKAEISSLHEVARLFRSGEVVNCKVCAESISQESIIGTIIDLSAGIVEILVDDETEMVRPLLPIEKSALLFLLTHDERHWV